MQGLPLSGASTQTRRALATAGQIGISALVLGLLVREAGGVDLDALRAAARPGWLALALAVKTTSLVLHELRLWVSFNPPRPPLRGVLAIGFASGVVNLVLPGRAGDLLAVGLLHRERGVPVSAAAASVGVVALLEAATFAVLLLVALIAGAARWEELLGGAAHREALSSATALTLVGVGLGVGIVTLARRAGPAPEGPGPLALLRQTLAEAGENLGTAATLAQNVGLSVLQVGLMVGAFALLFPALGLDVPAPVLAASGVLAASALASVLLPPGYGAGPAAAAVAILAAFGLEPAEALRYAAGYWLVSQAPAALLGLPFLRGRWPSPPPAA